MFRWSRAYLRADLFKDLLHARERETSIFLGLDASFCMFHMRMLM
jgi:hypothetical protein